MLVNHGLIEVAAPMGIELEELETLLPYLKGSRPWLLDLISLLGRDLFNNRRRAFDMKVILAGIVQPPSLLLLIPVFSRLSLICLAQYIIVIGFLRLMHGKLSRLLRNQSVGYLDVLDGDGTSSALLEQLLLLLLSL